VDHHQALVRGGQVRALRLGADDAIGYIYIASLYIDITVTNSPLAQVVPWTIIKRWFEEGKYVPYASEQMVQPDISI